MILSASSFVRIKCNNLGKVPDTCHYSINASFPFSFSSGPHAQTAWRPGRSPVRVPGPGLAGRGELRGARGALGNVELRVGWAWGRSRLHLGALWFPPLRPGSGSAAGVGKVGPWWGRGWENGVARLGTERLGLWPGLGSAGGRPQLRGAHCGPGPAATAWTQVMTAALGFFPLESSAPASILGGPGRAGLWGCLLSPLPSPVPSSLRPAFPSRLPSPRFSPCHRPRAGVPSDRPRRSFP